MHEMRSHGHAVDFTHARRRNKDHQSSIKQLDWRGIARQPSPAIITRWKYPANDVNFLIRNLPDLIIRIIVISTQKSFLARLRMIYDPTTDGQCEIAVSSSNHIKEHHFLCLFCMASAIQAACCGRDLLRGFAWATDGHSVISPALKRSNDPPKVLQMFAAPS